MAAEILNINYLRMFVRMLGAHWSTYLYNSSSHCHCLVNIISLKELTVQCGNVGCSKRELPEQRASSAVQLWLPERSYTCRILQCEYNERHTWVVWPTTVSQSTSLAGHCSITAQTTSRQVYQHDLLCDSLLPHVNSIIRPPDYGSGSHIYLCPVLLVL